MIRVRRQLWLAGVAAALTGAVAACDRTDQGDKPPKVVTITQSPLAGAFVQPPVDQKFGVLSIRMLWAKCGIESIVGTHAEYTPKHPLCVIRLRITNNSSGFVTFAAEQAKAHDIGGLIGIAKDVMNIKRQARSVEISSHGVVEQDLWFEPEGVQLETLLLPPIPDASGKLVQGEMNFRLAPGDG